ncbi:MAG: MHS family MFS transporter [Deltaproteobacteria bacterium]|jgi:MFS family permease|nr:MHS family MFS transporter [Deltaproteobacteria bacterium]
MTTTIPGQEPLASQDLDRLRARRAGIAAFVGTVLEWYDFIIYGTAAAIVLNKVFFPSQDPFVGTLAIFASYAVGFMVRPLGGLVLGYLGDKVGRKITLILTLFLMGGATTLIGCLPTYESIGVAAPVLLVICRMIQGFGAGGEYAGAVVLSVESAERGKRGAAGAWPPLGFAMATLLANAVFFLFLAVLPNEDFMSWGWRIPFLLGSLCVLVGYLVRRHIEEPAIFEKARAKAGAGKIGLFSSIRRHPRSFFVVIGSRMGENGFSYFYTVFCVSYLVNTLGFDRPASLWAVMIAAGVQLAAIPFYGRLSDRIGRRKVYGFGALFSILWMVPFFMMLGTASTTVVILAFAIGLGATFPAMLAPQGSWYAEMFDTEFRLAGFAFSRELGSILAGGVAPFIATALYRWAGHWWPIVVYMGILGALTLIALALGPETVHKNIED